MTWSQQQSNAIRSVQRWISDPTSPQVFRLFGYAGTGKTTIAKEIARGVGGNVLFAAFTGKAALVLRSKGCGEARTIHSLIYKVEEGDDGVPNFHLNAESEVLEASLLIIDECSMVDEELGRDLLGFGVRVLVLGDPAQLPPVKGAGFFTQCEPDALLTEIHRQAEDNPIIRLSMDVRNGIPLVLGEYGSSSVISRKQVDPDDVIAADQVLVGLNKTRRQFNKRIRQLTGRTSEFPEYADRIVCLKNDQKKGLLNGGLWGVSHAKGIDRHGIITLDVDPIDGGDAIPQTVHVPHNFFIGTEVDLSWKDRKFVEEFDFSYAMTVHKSQGSQFPSVMVFDESRIFKEDARRHLYTAITRAAERVIVVMP